MVFEDLTEDQIRRYAVMSADNMACQLLFRTQNNLLIELLADMGPAKDTADHIAEHIKAADIALALGMLRSDPEHHDLGEAIKQSIEGVNLAFDTVLAAVMAYIDVTKHCKCISCQRRRGVKVADAN